jgi:hypothetical protein
MHVKTESLPRALSATVAHDPFSFGLERSGSLILKRIRGVAGGEEGLSMNRTDGFHLPIWAGSIEQQRFKLCAARD